MRPDPSLGTNRIQICSRTQTDKTLKGKEHRRDNHIQQQNIMSTNISSHHKVKERLVYKLNEILLSFDFKNPSESFSVADSISKCCKYFCQRKDPQGFLTGGKIRCTMNKKLNNCASTSYKQIHCFHLPSATGHLHCSKNYM